MAQKYELGKGAAFGGRGRRARNVLSGISCARRACRGNKRCQLPQRGEERDARKASSEAEVVADTSLQSLGREADTRRDELLSPSRWEVIGL